MIDRIGSQPVSHASPDRQVSWFMTFQNYFADRLSVRKKPNFSLLRALNLVSLFMSVRGQLFPATLDLSNLNGITGFTLNGEQRDDQSGYSVANAGDVNDDGVPDIVIGAPQADPDSNRLDAGKTYVVFGKKGLGFSGVLELFSLNGTTGFILQGEKSRDGSGSSVSGAGDVNGDGVADLLIGAPAAAPLGRFNAGRTYVVFGRQGLGSDGLLELSSLDGISGFFIEGEQPGDISGTAVSGAGDVNGDRVDDLLISAPYAAPTPERGYAGKTYVVFGRIGLGSSGSLALSSLNGTAGFNINGDQANGVSGLSVAGAGDINDDGVADLVIGAPLIDSTSGSHQAGKTYVVFGKASLGSGGVLELASLDGTNGFVLNGEMGSSGRSVSVAYDVNGDGVADLLIGAPYRTPVSVRRFAGQTYVVFGRRGLGSSGMLDLSTINSTSGLIINGDQSDDNSGYSVDSTGDVDGDGVADLLIGAPAANPTADRMTAGKTYVVFGKASLGSVFELSSLNGTSGFTLNGDQELDRSGWSVSSVGDVNDDGVADFLIGALGGAPAPQRANAGKTYVVFGRRPAANPFQTTRQPAVMASTTSIANTAAVSTATSYNRYLTTSLNSKVAHIQTSPPDITTTTELTVMTHDWSATNTLQPPEETFPGLPLGIAGGVCAAALSLTATFVLKCRHHHSKEIPLSVPATEYAAIDSLDLPNPEPIYEELQLYPRDYTHYTSIDEVNRQHDEYESVAVANALRYASLPPQGCSEIGQLNCEHDEYESARFAPNHHNYDDIPIQDEE